MFPTKFLLLLTFCIFSRSQGVDVRVKGDKCSPQDSCSASNDQFRTCSCDEDCYKYGTCCVDAEHFPHMSTHPQEYHCYDDRVATPVFAKRTCDPKGDKVNHRIVCMEDENDKVDVLNSLLVTSSRTKITYWNRNCGLCNEEDPTDLAPWTVQVLCPDRHGSTLLQQKLIKRNLTYNWEGEQWGLKMGSDFVNCSIIQHQPVDLVGRLKYCAAAMVETCPPDHEMTKHCSAYHGERKLKDTNVYFKNVHCALCNGASLKDLVCIGRNYSPLKQTIFPNTIKVVFSADDWNKVMGGKHRYKCSKHFEYDPFATKCRKMNASNKAAKNIANMFTLFISFIILHKLLH